MEEFLAFVSKQFPTLFAVFVSLFLIWLIFREYRAARAELSALVDKSVDAKLGATLSKVQSMTVNLEAQEAAANATFDEVKGRSEQILNGLGAKEAEINSIFESVKSTISQFSKIVPSIEGLSAPEIFHALRNESDNAQQAAFAERLRDHPDASSSELERAGDRVRGIGRRALALELYSKSIEIDPENISAAMEYYCLKAEVVFAERDSALKKAKELAFKNLNRHLFIRITDAFIEVSRYRQLVDFCEEFLEIAEESETELRLLAYRNIAVGYKDLRDFRNSEKAYEKAFEIDPNDENTLKVYAGFLEQMKEFEAREKVVKKLIDTDPSDVSYYIMQLRGYMTQREFSKAESVLKIAKAVLTADDEQNRYFLGQYQNRLDRIAKAKQNDSEV